MRMSVHRVLFTMDLGRLLVWASDELPGYDVALGEVGRTLYQQREYVRLGVSRTLTSDHLWSLAADLVLYRRSPRDQDAGFDLLPVWDPETEAWQALGARWEAYDAQHNYWGYRRWGWDAPHFGRSRYPLADE